MWCCQLARLPRVLHRSRCDYAYSLSRLNIVLNDICLFISQGSLNGDVVALVTREGGLEICTTGPCQADVHPKSKALGLPPHNLTAQDSIKKPAWQLLPAVRSFTFGHLSAVPSLSVLVELSQPPRLLKAVMSGAAEQCASLLREDLSGSHAASALRTSFEQTYADDPHCLFAALTLSDEREALNCARVFLSVHKVKYLIDEGYLA
jgi:hypothetical protein